MLYAENSAIVDIRLGYVADEIRIVHNQTLSE